MRRLMSRFGLAGVSIALATSLQAQGVSSTLRSVTLNANKGELVEITAPTPISQSLQIADSALNTFATAITTTVSWDVNTSSSTSVKLVAYFDNPSQAFANGTNYLPAGMVEISVNGGAWAPVTGDAVGSVGIAGGSLVLYTSGATTGGNKRGTHDVSFQVRLNLLSNPVTTAGTYTATLRLMAICN